MEKFWSPGKLMITGEYLVISGAKALAVPTVLGQQLHFTHDRRRKTRIVNWVSMTPGELIWYSNQFIIDQNFEPSEQKGSERTEFIRSLLITINNSKPDFFAEQGTYNFKTFMDFDPGWGLGSSSSLIVNLAMLTDLQPFELVFQSTLNQGSGYDIATSLMGKPILYFIEEEMYHWAEPVELSWKKFANQCRLIYLNHKQDSNVEVSRFKSKWKENENRNFIEEISNISERITTVTDYEEFRQLLGRHELIMSEVLKKKCIKDELFPDFDGVIKSLGAWGGDFILACSNSTSEYTEKYFLEKGYQTIMDYSKMIDYEWK
ncbi:MAG: GYDIA family GHMP kinase [Bacteroidia bacterium]|nr:GYDIA family GHMP kinase [Bacteroidia bacterium]